MNLLQWNMAQIEESKSDKNRYYFNQHYGRDAISNEELLLYYIEYGAEIFSKLHKSEEDFNVP